MATDVQTAAGISQAEFKRRRDTARELAAERDLRGLVVWSRGGTAADYSGDVVYLANHHSAFPVVPDSPAWSARGHAAMVLPVDGPAVLLTDYLDDPDDRVAVDDMRVELDLPAAVGRAMREAGLAEGSVGLIGRESLSYLWHRELVAAAGAGVELRAADDLLARLRAVKSPAELECVRRAAAVGVEWMNTTMGAIAEGRTQGDAVGEGLRYLARHGGTQYDVAISSGDKSGHYFGSSGTPHWNSTRTFAEGDLVHVDQWGPVLDYYTDFARSTVVGRRPTDAQREVLEASVSLIDHIVAGVRPGVSFDELYRSGAGWLSEHGFATHDASAAEAGQVFGQQFPCFGHCIGLTVEGPWIIAGEQTRLEEGMVLAIETVVGRPQVGSSNFEQNVIVGADGPEVLTAACPARWWD